jgi:hypothetical protein
MLQWNPGPTAICQRLLQGLRVIPRWQDSSNALRAVLRPLPRFIIATILLAAGARPTQAAALSLFTTASPGNALVMTAQSPGGHLQLGVANGSVFDPPEEFLTAWQVRLRITPDAGAAGTVDFVSGAEPDNYLFDNVGHSGPSVTITQPITGSQLFASDVNVPASGGVNVPEPPGARLLDIAVAAAPNALGSFGLYALAGLTNSEWTDANTPVQQRRTFSNVPDQGGPVRIADLLVTYAADFDRDLDVDADDLLFWKTAYGTGDFSDADRDGDTDGNDFLIWQRQLGSAAGAQTLATTVPEPTLAALMLPALLILCKSRLRRGGTPNIRAGRVLELPDSSQRGQSVDQFADCYVMSARGALPRGDGLERHVLFCGSPQPLKQRGIAVGRGS